MKTQALIVSLLAAVIAWPPGPVQAQPNVVRVFEDSGGMKLQVDGEDFMVFGMNWGYLPIGQNYRYDLWSESDAFIREVLDMEMSMLRDMGVNTIRLFNDIPPRWVTYIYENYGIYTAINHLFGRYGFTVDGAYIGQTDYGDEAMVQAILEDVRRTVETYRDTPGVLMFLLGNENNYGLAWTSFEIEDVPDEVEDPRADTLYRVWCRGVSVVSEADDNHPVAIVNGDTQYLDLVARYCDDLDVFGTNMYRGRSARDAFQRVRDELGLPMMFTEFGADAYNARLQREDDVTQARYLLAQWQEIYEQSYGKGRIGNAIGGMIFQWSDGWWKYRQEENLDVHDTNASWATDAYAEDYVEGQNNMNEEWWGITAKNPPDERGIYTVDPRTAYYVLREAFQLDPYAGTTTLDAIRAYFGAIRVSELADRYATSRALSELEQLGAVRVSQLRMLFDSSVSGGDENTERGAGNGREFGHTESVYVDVELNPSSSVYGRLSINGVGAVAQNRLDNLFYENRALEPEEVVFEEGGLTTTGEAREVDDRFAIYQAEFTIDRPLFTLDGFFRTGHFHWGYEGDFFGLYPEAYYGPNLDIYNGQAPNGAELTMHGPLEGLKLAIGPELWWGANPAAIVKYYRELDGWRFAIVHHEDFVESNTAQSSFAVPEQLNRRTSLYLGVDVASFTLELAGLMSGSTKIDDEFVYVEETAGRGYLDSGYEVLEDQVGWGDLFGGRLRLLYEGGAFRWYGQGSLHGLVADGGYNPAIVVTGWRLQESGRGNHWAASTGASYRLGNFEIAPNFLYQQPLIGANPQIDDYFSEESGLYYGAVRPRNILDDPFTVLDNRETVGGELLIVYDPTPGTWFHGWDRDLREDSSFTAALDFWYRHQPERRDAYTFTLEDGTIVAFGDTPEPADEWEASLHFAGVPARRLRLAGTIYAGEAEPRNQGSPDQDRNTILRYGADLRAWYRTMLVDTRLKFDDWGPYDFHRDFNLTYPLQWYVDVSYGLTVPALEWTDTRFGIRTQVRTLDGFSPDYVPDPGDVGCVPEEAACEGRGLEWEVGTYVNIGL